MDGLCYALQVLGVQAANADTTILCHVDMVLINERLDLVGRKTAESKHADLLRNVAPILLRANTLKCGHQALSHVPDSIGHHGHITLPQLLQLGVIENGGNDACAVDRRVTVLSANGDGQLAADSFGFFLRVAHNVQRTSAFAIQSKVLGIRLANKRRMSVLDELANRSGILVRIAASKGLICHIEENNVVTFLTDLGDFLPGIDIRINTGRVVRAGVQ